jgi:hypothetical protein
MRMFQVYHTRQAKADYTGTASCDPLTVIRFPLRGILAPLFTLICPG